jgi:hypothetical protein
MSNFERRLGIVQRRPDAPSGSKLGAGDTAPSASSVAWQAAEKVSHLTGVEPDTTIKITVDSPTDQTVVEVSWDADGVPLIRERLTPRPGAE